MSFLHLDLGDIQLEQGKVCSFENDNSSQHFRSIAMKNIRLLNSFRYWGEILLLSILNTKCFVMKFTVIK